METKDIERLALERSLDLAQIRQRIIDAGEELGLTRWTTLLPEFSAGPKGERQRWSMGGRATTRVCDSVIRPRSGASGRAAAELRRFQQEYYALGVRIRAQARAVRDRLEGASDRASVLSRYFVAACTSASSMKHNFNTTPCSSVHFNFYAPESSRSKRQSGTSKRCAITGSPEQTWSKFLSGRLPSSMTRPSSGTRDRRE